MCHSGQQQPRHALACTCCPMCAMHFGPALVDTIIINSSQRVARRFVKRPPHPPTYTHNTWWSTTHARAVSSASCLLVAPCRAGP
jgi:hypothetical protein